MENGQFERLLAEFAESRRHTEGLMAEMRRHFDVVGEGLRHDLQLVAEGVTANSEAIVRLEGRVDRIDGRLERLEVRVDGIEVRMQDGFAEVKSMIRYGYSDLDRRVRALEGSA